MDYFAGMLRRLAPPGVVNYSWYECSSTFMQERGAMYLDAIGFGAQFEDREKSRIVGKGGYLASPAGPAGRFSTLSTNAVGVSAHSKRQGPAYFFIQWATSKPIAAKALVDGTLGPRASIWDDPEVKAKAKMPPDWSMAYRDSLTVGVPSQPEIVGVTEYRDIIGAAIQRAIEGAKSEVVLAQAQKEPQGCRGPHWRGCRRVVRERHVGRPLRHGELGRDPLARFGERDRAVAALERYVAASPQARDLVRHDPRYAAMREHPRMRQLLR